MSTEASSEQVADQPKPTKTEPSFWRRVGGWIRPSSSPDPLRFNTKSDTLLGQLTTANAAVADELLTEAQAAYKEVTERGESAERRAATIQGTIAIASSLTLAGGSLLLSAGDVPSRGWRIGLSIGVAVTVIVFAAAAWRAFLVTWPRFLWASPDVQDIVEHARESTAEKIKLRRTSDLLVAYGRNDSIARLKLQLLGQAVRWLMAALALLALLAAALAAYAIERPSSPPVTHSTPLQRTQRPAGSQP